MSALRRKKSEKGDKTIKANKVRMILTGMMTVSMMLSAVPAMAQEETEVQAETATTEAESEN